MCACRSGRTPIPGLVYSQKAPGIALRQAWTASMEAAVTCPELALALRQFDAGGRLAHWHLDGQLLPASNAES